MITDIVKNLLPKSKNEFNLMIQSLTYEINEAISEGYDTFMFGPVFNPCNGYISKKRRYKSLMCPIV